MFEKIDSSKDEEVMEAEQEGYPFRAVDPATGLVESFKTQAEMEKWKEEAHERMKDNNP